MPQCGLAPGFISIAAAELITHFDELRAVKLRVGALPQHPNNVLKYSLTWSTEGLINEYGNPCQAISDGRLIEVAPLEGLEEIEIDGTLYEAFNTSGGLGSLAETHGAHIESMNYKTMRYPGHCAQMRLLMNDLKLNHDRSHAQAHPGERRAADAAGRSDRVRGGERHTGRPAARGELRQQDLSAGDRRPAVVGDPGDHGRRHHRCGGSRARAQGRVRGFVAQEQFRLTDILANRFGRYYAPGGTKQISGEVVVSGAAGHQRRKEAVSA